VRSHNGTAFIMWDYEYLHQMSKGISTIYTYGTREADLIGKIFQTDPFLQVEFEKGYTGTIKTNLVGSYNMPNVLAAVAIGKYFNAEEDKIKNAIEGYAPSNSRSQLLQRGNSKIILDAYNANPSSMKAAIENFASIKGTPKILALGAMAELGADSLQEHATIIEEIKKYPWKEVVLVGGDFNKLQHPYRQFNSPKEAGEWMRDKVDHAFLLIKGSRSMQMEKLLEYI
jgi:UDP-N-acetylmuramoyl-tripeptide--D-alanyl-D-alanine ligase